MTESPTPLLDLEPSIRLSSEARWFLGGEEITHERTTRLFFRSIRHDEQGFFLKVGDQIRRIAVEDTPYFVLGISRISAAQWTIALSDESQETLLSETLAYSPGRLTCRVKNLAFEARFLRQPYYELLQLMSERPDGYYLNFEDSEILLAKK